MKQTLRHSFVFFLLLTAACATTEADQQHASYQGNWESMKYTDFAAVDTSGLLRMGK